MLTDEALAAHIAELQATRHVRNAKGGAVGTHWASCECVYLAVAEELQKARETIYLLRIELKHARNSPQF